MATDTAAKGLHALVLAAGDHETHRFEAACHFLGGVKGLDRLGGVEARGAGCDRYQHHEGPDEAMEHGPGEGKRDTDPESSI